MSAKNSNVLSVIAKNSLYFMFISLFVVYVWHEGRNQHLGYFDEGQDAARAFDEAALRLRGDQADGGAYRWHADLVAELCHGGTDRGRSRNQDGGGGEGVGGRGAGSAARGGGGAHLALRWGELAQGRRLIKN